MKHIIYRMLIAILAFSFAYLLGSFSEVSFDISMWDEQTRFMVALFGGLLAIAFATFPNYNFEE